ncbi:MAG: sodium-dependent transporter [Verrucomicrobiota bacterium]
MSGANRREGWGTRVGVILAVTGSAVGLGNFLRFPGTAAEYGGAFMIPYVIALLLLGLPIAWAEWAMGRYGGVRGFNSSPGIFRIICNRAKGAPYLGVLGLLVPVMIYTYYVFIEAWCLGYAYHYLAYGFGWDSSNPADQGFFGSFIGNNADGELFMHPAHPTLVFLGICVVLNFVLIYRGISKGIEWFALRAMPLLVICAIIIVIRVLTLGTPDPDKPDLNVINALGYMWNPVYGGKSLWVSLQNAEMWLEAAGQIFFSLSVGFGVIITYSSYLKQRDDIALSSTTAVAGNEWCEVALGGMMAIPAAFLFLGAEGAGGSTFSLGFTSLPKVFLEMPAGWVFGFLFFFLLFFAAVTSSISMLQPAIAFLEEGLGLDRKGSVCLLGFVTIIGTAFVVYFSADTKALASIDFWVGNFCIYVLATIQVILFGWVLGLKKGFIELDSGAELRIPRFVGFIIKYVSPVFLIVIFAVWVAQNFGKYVDQFQQDNIVRWSLMLIGLFLVFFVVLTMQAVKRWERQEQSERAEGGASI